jgi:hypothetical protein
MKKSKLSLGLIACLLSVGSLAGCDKVKSSDDGVLLSYTVDGSKTPIEVKAQDILEEYYDDSSKYQAIFDAVYNVIKLNYFSKDRGTKTLTDGYNYKTTIKLGKSQMTKINADADEQVANDKTKAQDNADANGPRYKKEFEAILAEKGVKTEAELREKYVEDLKKETFDNNLNEYFVDELRGEAGTQTIALSTGEDFVWNGYLKDQSPYHMSHLMVKLDDSSDTNYSNGTITSSNAENLYYAVSRLAKGGGNNKFKDIAGSKLNEDTSSKEKNGDLGIMDYGTSFINEFKLGIYAYEQLFLGVNTKMKFGTEDVEVESQTKISETNAAKYWEHTGKAFNLSVDGDEKVTDIPTVNYSVFKELFDCREEETDSETKQVIKGNSLVFPRNIIYNKYLNRHAVFFIEGTTGDGANFKEVTFKDQNGDNVPKTVLCADGNPEQPIVAVRGSSQGSQEIHFMVVNRSPFRTYEEAASHPEVSLSQYYNTYHYRNDLYPRKDGVKLETYTNFLGDDNSDSKSRAEDVASKFKSYDSEKLTKYAFLKFMEIEKVKFSDSCKKIEKALMDWIYTSIDKKAEENKETWKKTWSEYLDKLSRQNAERSKLIPQACRVGFTYGNNNITFIDALDQLVVDEKVTATERAALEEVIKQDLVDLGYATSLSDAATKLDTWKVVEAFKNEGGLCNDGEQYL